MGKSHKKNAACQFLLHPVYILTIAKICFSISGADRDTTDFTPVIFLNVIAQCSRGVTSKLVTVFISLEFPLLQQVNPAIISILDFGFNLFN